MLINSDLIDLQFRETLRDKFPTLIFREGGERDPRLHLYYVDITGV